jgi:hypothetical protein
MAQDSYTIPLLERQYGGDYKGPYNGLKPVKVFECKPEEAPFKLPSGERYSIDIFDQTRMTRGVYYEDIPTEEEIAQFIKRCNDAIKSEKDEVYICNRNLKQENGEVSLYTKHWYLLNDDQYGEYVILYKISGPPRVIPSPGEF